jgi:hypothetical protein
MVNGEAAVNLNVNVNYSSTRSNILVLCADHRDQGIIPVASFSRDTRCV